MKIMTFEQFATINGASRFDFSEPGMHVRGHMSDTAHRRALRQQSETSEALDARRDALRIKYQQCVDRGEIREPTQTERMIERANGHPDLQSTQAARRVLARRGVKW